MIGRSPWSEMAVSLWDIDIMTNNQPEPIDKLLELADQLSAEERSREPAKAPPGNDFKPFWKLHWACHPLWTISPLQQMDSLNRWIPHHLLFRHHKRQFDHHVFCHPDADHHDVDHHDVDHHALHHHDYHLDHNPYGAARSLSIPANRSADVSPWVDLFFCRPGMICQISISIHLTRLKASEFCNEVGCTPNSARLSKTAFFSPENMAKTLEKHLGDV